MSGKRDKIRYVPVHASAQRLIEEYLTEAGHAGDLSGALFRPVKNNSTVEGLDRPLEPNSIYRNVVRHYALMVGLSGEVNGCACIPCGPQPPRMP